MQQLSLIDFSFPTELEKLKATLNEMIIKNCLEQEINPNFLSLEDRIQTIDNIPNVIGYSIWILEPMSMNKSDRIFSIVPKITRKSKRFEVELKYERRNLIAAPYNSEEKIYKIKKEEDGKIYITNKYVLNIPLDSQDIYNYLNQWIQKALQDFTPSDTFGCCGKYEECSNAGKCLHNNNFYARCCYYRRNLESGKIFYGKNKNI